MDRNKLGELIHGSAPYDPVKAHEYYIRTRHLKNRHANAKAPVSAQVRGSAPVTSAPPRPSGPKASGQSHAEMKAAASQRVDALNARLDRLRLVLERLVAQAKGRSGIDPQASPTASSTSKSKTTKSTTDTAKKTAASKDTKEKPLTAAQKAQARKRAHDSYIRNRKLKGDSPSQGQAAAIKSQIASVQEQIATLRGELKAAVEQARKQGTDQATNTSQTEPVQGRRH